jgi:hypothetical protein
MNKIGILSTVMDENWLSRLRWSLAITGKFSGLRMAPGTSYDFLSCFRNNLDRLDASVWQRPVRRRRLIASGLRHVNPRHCTVCS